MKHFVIALLYGFIGLSGLSAQALTLCVIASDGGTFRGSGIQLDYTLGEFAVDQLTGQTISMTEGFHQPILIIALEEDQPLDSTISKSMEPEILISLSPNPVNAELTIKFSNPASGQIALQVMNANGNIVIEQKLNPLFGDTSLDLAGLLPGIYYFHFTSADQPIRTTYKISKF